MLNKLTLVLLNPDITCLRKQCRSRSVGFRRSTLFAIKYVNLYQQPDQVIWLAENYKWVWLLNLFSRTRVKRSLPLQIFIQWDCLIQIVDTNSHMEWQTVTIQISGWLLQKPADLDLHCLQIQGISGSAGLETSALYSACINCQNQEVPGLPSSNIWKPWWSNVFTHFQKFNINVKVRKSQDFLAPISGSLGDQMFSLTFRNSTSVFINSYLWSKTAILNP